MTYMTSTVSGLFATWICVSYLQRVFGGAFHLAPQLTHAVNLPGPFCFFLFQQLVIEAAIMFQTCVAVHLHTAEKRPSDSDSVRCGVCLHISPRRRSGKLSAPHSLHHPTISPSFFCSLVANTLSIRRLKLATHPPDTPLLACARRAASSHTQ